MHCASCQAEIPDGGRFCPACAAPLTLDAETMEPVARYRPPSSRNASSEEGRFQPGQLLLDRYRVISLIGRGGMGEVYRATDLTLNQPVALKFLPTATVGRPDLLERFHGEVRIARQVSHPNVCRVYDIGAVDGAAFISMEYVDGEDLAGLLRRIGRLPTDKALEIARKLCAGLAAAHAKGVLHRDLKPANIMIDGRGQVLIMDFGLAAIADQMAGVGVLEGTPAYMAPEQLAGQEVTERSDIYALGLVLFEIFTGQRAFKSADRSTVPSASSASRDVDPVVERVIARCLDPDPTTRPPTALALARMLPGGDPLAEALAAGDTPTPAMVAASDATGALSVRGAVACMALVVVGLVALLLMTAKSNILRLTPLPHSHEVLAQEARELAASFGYTDPPLDSYNGFEFRDAYKTWAEKNLKPEEYREQVRRGQPALIHFFYNESPQYFEPRAPSGRPSANDPPLDVPGMVRVILDPEGRLRYFAAVPPQEDDGAPAAAMDWDALFLAARLDRARWTEVPPKMIPPFAFDERRAWTGSFTHSPDMPLRIESAAWRGRAISFGLYGPWSDGDVQPSTGATIRRAWIGTVISSLLLLCGSWLAWRNYRAGRSDVRGAMRLAAVGFVAQSLGGLVAIHHVPTPSEGSRLINALGFGLFIAALACVLYLALEPFVRRRWPQSLISWTRLLAGDVRDPLVAGHILLGVTFAIAVAILANGMEWYQWQAQGKLTFNGNRIGTLKAVLMARMLLTGVIQPAAIVMGAFFLFVLLRLVLRSTWVTVGVVLAVPLIAGLRDDQGLLVVAASMSSLSLLLWVTLRFGILPGTLIVTFTTLVGTLPLTSDFSAWYASRGLTVVALTLGVAVWSFRHALAGRRVLSERFLDV